MDDNLPLFARRLLALVSHVDDYDGAEIEKIVNEVVADQLNRFNLFDPVLREAILIDHIIRAAGTALSFSPYAATRKQAFHLREFAARSIDPVYLVVPTGFVVNPEFNDKRTVD